MAEQTDVILQRIRKLFALAESPNEHEAALAMEKAHALLREYNLDTRDLEVDDVEVVEEAIDSGSRERVWKSQLIQQVCRTNYCDIYRHVSRGTRRSDGAVVRTYSLRVVGRPHNVATAKVMTDYLVSSVERLARSVDGRGRDSYRFGLATRLCERLRELRRSEAEGDERSRALVVSEDATLREYLRRLRLMRARPRRKLVSPEAYRRGVQDGDDISLHPQVDTPPGPDGAGTA